MHLCIMVASFRMSLSLIGSQFNDRSPSEIWSYFLSPKIIRPAKFWTFCNLAILLLLVLLQTVEQYSSLLKTKEFITNKSVFLSSRCLILLICFSLRRQFETVLVKRFYLLHCTGPQAGQSWKRNTLYQIDFCAKSFTYLLWHTTWLCTVKNWQPVPFYTIFVHIEWFTAAYRLSCILDLSISGAPTPIWS